MGETKGKFSLPSLLGLLGGGLGVAATFFAWFTIDGKDFIPWDETTGKITLVLAAVAALCGLVTIMKKTRGIGVLLLILGLLYSGVVALNYPPEELAGVLAYGYWIAVIGGGLVILAGLWKTITK